MATSTARFSREEFSRKGQEIYDREVRQNLRPADENKFVAIDIESRNFEIDADDYTATERLLNRLPNAQIWLMKVGQPAAYRISARSVGGRVMISGTVNSRYEIIVRVPVRDAAGQEHEIETVLDTGFAGSLTLPPALIASLGLPFRTQSNVILANGQVEQVDNYVATLIWDGIPRVILVQCLDNDPLLGTVLLVGFDLRARMEIGGDVQIEAIP